MIVSLNSSLCVCGHRKGWHEAPDDVFPDEFTGACDVREDGTLIRVGCTCSHFKLAAPIPT